MLKNDQGKQRAKLFEMGAVRDEKVLNDGSWELALKITEKDILSTNEVKFLGNNIKFNKINLTKKNYSFGIRPEHFSLSENCQYKFKPNIDLTENLGNEKIAYIKIDGNEISAKIPSQNNIIDQIGFDMKDIFVFDETGTRVRS